MRNKPRTLADYIINTKKRINKAAFEAGMYLFGGYTTSKKKCDLPAERLHPEDAAELLTPPSPPSPATDNEAPKSAAELASINELLRLDRELAALRLAYQNAYDDLERNTIHFKIIRLERTRREHVAKHNI